MAKSTLELLVVLKDKASKAVKDLKNSFNKTAKETDKATKSVKKFSSGLSSAKSAASAFITVGLVAAVGSLGKKILNLAGEAEALAVSFEVLSGSAESGKSMLLQIERLAAKTPFAINELEEMAKRLLAVGVGAEEVIPDLKVLGEIAAGVGKDKFPRLVLAFSQVRTATKLYGSELRQFRENGVPLLDELAKRFGVTVSQIEEMVSAGEIGFDDVRGALAALSKEGGRFDNLMNRISKTQVGLISNIGDNLIRVSRRIGKDFQFHLKPILEVTQKITDPDTWDLTVPLLKMKAVLARMNIAMLEFGNKMRTGIRNLKDAFLDLFDFNNYEGISRTLVESAGKIANRIADITGSALAKLGVKNKKTEKEVINSQVAIQNKLSESEAKRVSEDKAANERIAQAKEDLASLLIRLDQEVLASSKDTLGAIVVKSKDTADEIERANSDLISSTLRGSQTLQSKLSDLDEDEIRRQIDKLNKIKGLKNDNTNDLKQLDQSLFNFSNELNRRDVELRVKSQEKAAGIIAGFVQAGLDPEGFDFSKMGKAIQDFLTNQLVVWAGAETAKLILSAPATFGASLAGIPIVAARLAAGVAAIRAIRFAQGGVVPGSSTVGDRVPILANSGEMILNKGQQSELFNALNSGGNNEQGQAVTINFNGPLMGDARQAKELAKMIDQELITLSRTRQRVS